MSHRISAHVHTVSSIVLARIALRLRSRSERGQGTVEYVALILLVAGVLAVAAAAAGASGRSFQFGEVVTKELKQAIDTVSK